MIIETAPAPSVELSHRPQIVNAPRACLNHLVPPCGLYTLPQKEEIRVRLNTLAAKRNAAGDALMPAAEFDPDFCISQPELVLAAGPGLLKHMLFRRRIKLDPLLAVKMLISSYDLTRQILDDTVRSSGEACIAVLHAIEQEQLPPTVSRDPYESTLLEQSWWGFHYLCGPVSGDGKVDARAHFAARLIDRCEQFKKENAQSALVYFLLQPAEDPTACESVFCRDSMVAYLASRFLRPRGVDLSLDRVSGLNSRWATHIALWGNFTSSAKERLFDVIAEHPGWAGEYLARKPSEAGDFKIQTELYRKVMEFDKSKRGSERDVWPELLYALIHRLRLRACGQKCEVTFAESLLEMNPMPEAARS